MPLSSSTPLLSCWQLTQLVATVIYETLLSHFSSCGKDQRRKCSLFNFCDSFAVHAFLFILVHAVMMFGSQIYVRLCIWVTYPDIKECRSLFLPKATCMYVKSGVSWFVWSWIKGFPSTSCSAGSMCTSLQTMFRSLASKSRNSLWR